MAAGRWTLPAIAAGTWLTILLGIWLHAFAVVATMASGVLAILAFLLDRRGVRAIWAFMVSVMLVGGVSVLVHDELRNPAVLAHVEESTTALFRTSQTLSPGSRVAHGAIIQVDSEKIVAVPAIAILDGVGHRLPPGVTLEIGGDFQQAQPLTTAAWRVFVTQWRVVAAAPGILAGSDALREGFLDRSRSMGGDGGGLLPGLALGDTEAVSESLTADMRRSALAHLVAVSGANCALIVAVAIGVVTVFRGGVWWRVGAGVVALLGFIVLVTPEASVIRASVMATLTLLAIALGRPQTALHALCLTSWIILLIDPWRAVDISFLLSVAATAGIVMGFVPTATFLERFVPRRVALALALPLIAQLAVMPLTVILRPSLPTYGVVANLLAAPFVPLVSILGIFGSLAGGPWPGAGTFFAQLGWYPASAIAAIARATAALPGSELPWLSGVTGVATATLVSAGTMWWIRGQRLGGLLALATVGAVVMSVQGPRLVSRLSVPSDWVVAQCDVGQGDAVVFRSSLGATLIDTGNEEAKLRECLEVLGISRLRYLVLTHFDIDHMGQAMVLRGRVDTVVHGPPDNDDDRWLLEDLRSSGAELIQVAAGDVLDLGDYQAKVLWPLCPVISEPGNDSSVTLWVEPVKGQQGVTVLTLGDLGATAQQMLLPRLPGKQVGLVKVSHHGSPDQLPELYSTIDADLGFVGVGSGNTYGHPADKTLSLLSGLGTKALRSDQRGIITVSPRTSGYALWSERGG